VSRRTADVAEWVDNLLELRRYLLWYARTYYGRSTAEFLKVRLSGAEKIITRSSIRVLSAVPRGCGVTMLVASTKSVEEGAERIVKVRALNGSVIEVSLGVPAEEAFHVTQVGCYGMKCTCVDAVLTASKADKLFLRGLKSCGIRRVDVPTPIFTKYVVCKHTLAAASYSLTLGTIPKDSQLFREVLKLSVLASALRTQGLEAVECRTLERAYMKILRLSKGIQL